VYVDIWYFKELIFIEWVISVRVTLHLAYIPENGSFSGKKFTDD